MPKKKFFADYYMPGVMSAIALLSGWIIAYILDIFFSMEQFAGIIFLVLFIGGAVAGEIWQYKKRRPHVEAGEILQSHPFAISAAIILIFAGLFLVAGVYSVLKAVDPYNFHFDSWSWMAVNGIVWDIMSFSILAIILSILALYVSMREKKNSKWLAILCIVIAVIIGFFGMEFISPIVRGIDEAMIYSVKQDQNEKWHEKLEETRAKNKTATEPETESIQTTDE